MIKSTLCYIRKGDEYLMLFRDKKEKDVNEGKWVGVGGKFKENESAEECLLREVREETGLALSNYTFHGIVHFHSDEWEDEDMYLFSADIDDSADLLPDCPEGTLKFVPKDDLLTLPMWEGDKYFLEELLADNIDINMHLYYKGDALIRKKVKHMNYEKISAEAEKELRKRLCDDGEPLRRQALEKDSESIWRTAYIRDVDKIINCPPYNRYADKTQVFSFYKNDDITRRALHVQIVSRTARTIGRALGLNENLIEAMALGHDIGHTPFGHAGEACLDKISFARTGRHFAHNLHSVRVLDQIYPLNLTLNTLSGIVSHDGEIEQAHYEPDTTVSTFAQFDEIVEECYRDKKNLLLLRPTTLEGCVVRISDIIAYLGKDRQDAQKVHKDAVFTPTEIGTINAEIINNLIVNIIENSLGKNYIALDDKHFEALKLAKRENYEKIYLQTDTQEMVEPLMTRIYDRLLEDLTSGNL